MSTRAKDVVDDDAEAIAQRALDRVRHAASVSPSQNHIALTIAGEEAPIEIPAEASAALIAALTNLAAGYQVSVLPRARELSTVQAAETLNVSRPHLIKLLDEGKIAFRKVGTHRRVETASLLAFKAEDDERARGAADALVQLSEEMGIDQ